MHVRARIITASHTVKTTVGTCFVTRVALDQLHPRSTSRSRSARAGAHATRASSTQCEQRGHDTLLLILSKSSAPRDIALPYAVEPGKGVVLRGRLSAALVACVRACVSTSNTTWWNDTSYCQGWGPWSCSYSSPAHLGRLGDSFAKVSCALGMPRSKHPSPQ